MTQQITLTTLSKHKLYWVIGLIYLAAALAIIFQLIYTIYGLVVTIPPFNQTRIVCSHSPKDFDLWQLHWHAVISVDYIITPRIKVFFEPVLHLDWISVSISDGSLYFDTTLRDLPPLKRTPVMSWHYLDPSSLLFDMSINVTFPCLPAAALPTTDQFKLMSDSFGLDFGADVVVTVIMLCTVAIGVLYYRRLRRIPRQAVLPEQYWIFMLFVASFLIANPLTWLGFAVPPTLSVTNHVTALVSICLFMMFMHFYVDGLRQTNLSHPGWRFYLPKVWAPILLIASTTVDTFILERTLELSTKTPTLTFSQFKAVSWSPAVVWMLLFVRATFRTRTTLKHYDYMPTRNRQLGFRFFLLITFVLIIFLLFVAVGSALFNFDFHGFSFTLLYSVYSWLFAFVYLPVSSRHSTLQSDEDWSTVTVVTGEEHEVPPTLARQMENRPVVCLGTVNRLLRFSWEVYYSPDSMTSRTCSTRSLRSSARLSTTATKVTVDNDSAPLLIPGATHTDRLNDSSAYRSSDRLGKSSTDASSVRVDDGSGGRSVDHSTDGPAGDRIVSSVGPSAAAAGTLDAAATPSASPSLYRRDGEKASEAAAKDRRLLDVEQFGYELVDYIADESTDTHALVAIRDRSCVVAFRGTASATNARTDLKFSRVVWEPEPPSSDHHSHAYTSLLSRTCSVHGGFWDAYCSVKHRILGTVASLARTEPQLVVEVTGHSLGGALAVLAAYDLRMRLPASVKVSLYTFGAPRVGNRSFALVFNQAVPNAFRICNEQDLITQVPKMFFLFKHVGVECIQDPFGNMIVSPSVVETMLRPARNNVGQHLMQSYVDNLNAVTARARDLSSFVEDSVSVNIEMLEMASHPS